MERLTLKEVRLKRGFLQREVAFKSDICRSFYCQIENGSRIPSLKVAKRICIVLGINLETFYDCIILNKN